MTSQAQAWADKALRAEQAVEDVNASAPEGRGQAWRSDVLRSSGSNEISIRIVGSAPAIVLTEDDAARLRDWLTEILS